MSRVTDARTVVAPVVPGTIGVLQPVSIGEVSISGGLLGELQQRNQRAILPHVQEWIERAGWVENFRRATAGDVVGNRQGREFSDSEIYKVLEAMSWEHGRSGDAELDERIRQLTAVVVDAQESDGYINTTFGREGQRPRYSDFEWGHELYNYGHLLQAAVARGRVVGADDPLVEAARAVAEHICREFGQDGREAICGHPGVEVGLIEFGRFLDEPRYVEQGRRFLVLRGRGLLGPVEFGQEYFQDDVPIAEATVLRGHAVRAVYLTAGAADAAVEAEDRALLDILEAQWRTTVGRRMYLTGAIGSRQFGEAFGADWELPSDSAYCGDLCERRHDHGGLATLLLATGEPHYGDLIERVLTNVIATSPAADGHSFFYSNRMQQRTPSIAPDPDRIESRVGNGLRAPWYEVSCCPPNVSRTLASVGALMAARDDDGLRLIQYATAEISTVIADEPLELHVTADYPRSGVIEVAVVAAPADWMLRLRVPDWATGARLEATGTPSQPVTPGWAMVRSPASGSTVRLTLPVEPRFTFPDPRIDAIRGTVAVECGPEVFCLESVDLADGIHVDDIVVDTDAGLTQPAPGVVQAVGRVEHRADGAWPYQTEVVEELDGPIDLVLHPYHDWANRGPTEMRIWLRRD